MRGKDRGTRKGNWGKKKAGMKEKAGEGEVAGGGKETGEGPKIIVIS